MNRAHALVSGALLLVVAACTDDPSQDPCDLDPAGCGSSFDGTIPVDPSCTIAGPLTAELGWGEEMFRTFETPPEVHYGLQGGAHVFVAVRIANAEIDAVRQIRLGLSSYQEMSQEECATAISSARASNPSDLPSELQSGAYSVLPAETPVVINGPETQDAGQTTVSRCLMAWAQRVVVMGSDDPEGGLPGGLKIDEQGRVHEETLLLQVPAYSDPSLPIHLSLAATDACGRHGFASYAWSRPQ